MGDILGDFIGLPDVTGQYGYGIAPHTVHADPGWVGLLIFYMGGNGADTNAHGTNEAECILFVEILFYEIGKG